MLHNQSFDPAACWKTLAPKAASRLGPNVNQILRCAVSLLSVLVCLIAATASAQNSKPNVLLISIDDLNDWVGYLAKDAGDDHLLKLIVPDDKKRQALTKWLTPSIDRLALQSVAFTRAYCNAPLCGPSRISLLTGLYPSTLGYFNHDVDFRTSLPRGRDLVTLPQHLRANGYDTIEAGKIFHISRRGQKDQPSHPQSDPVSWTAQHIQWCGCRWNFPPVSVGNQHYQGNPWVFHPQTRQRDVEQKGRYPAPSGAELAMGNRWHNNEISGSYFPIYFNFGPLPDPNDGKYHPRFRISKHQTFDYSHADYVATFLANLERGKDRFTTDVCPGKLPADETRLNGVYPMTHKPFLIAFGCFRPHDPFIVPKHYFESLQQILTVDDLDIAALHRLNGAYYEDPQTRRIDKMPKIGRQLANLCRLHQAMLIAGRKNHNDELHYWRQAVFAYLACIRYADDCVGRVLEGLEQSPQKHNTVVVLLSDHGLHFGTKEHWAKMSLWDEATHIPFLIKAPGVKPGICRRMVSLVDLYPTMLDLLQLEPPAQQLETAQTLEGISLLPLLKDPDAAWNRPAIISYQTSGGETGRCFAAVDNRFRLIRYTKTAEQELYDQQNDPREIHNLLPFAATTEPQVRAAYRALDKALNQAISRNNSWK